jgi:hypothetical protein
LKLILFVHLTQGEFDFNESDVEGVNVVFFGHGLQTHPISSFFPTSQFVTDVDKMWIGHLKSNLIWNPKVKLAAFIISDTQT